jgi:hypothetical protein
MSLADDECYICGRRFGDDPPPAGEWIEDDPQVQLEVETLREMRTTP